MSVDSTPTPIQKAKGGKPITHSQRPTRKPRRGWVRKRAFRKRKTWTPKEDEMIIRLVKELGLSKWAQIAKHIEGRIGKQCRERWHNFLNPNINRQPWSEEEEFLLFLWHKAIGNRWSVIAKAVQGRSDNAIKNYWNSNMKKKIEPYLERYHRIVRGGVINEGEKISPEVRTIVVRLMKLGEKDYHSTRGIFGTSIRQLRKKSRKEAKIKRKAEVQKKHMQAKSAPTLTQDDDALTAVSETFEARHHPAPQPRPKTKSCGNPLRLSLTISQHIQNQYQNLKLQAPPVERKESFIDMCLESEVELTEVTSPATDCNLVPTPPTHLLLLTPSTCPAQAEYDCPEYYLSHDYKLGEDPKVMLRKSLEPYDHSGCKDAHLQPVYLKRATQEDTITNFEQLQEEYFQRRRKIPNLRRMPSLLGADETTFSILNPTSSHIEVDSGTFTSNYYSEADELPESTGFFAFTPRKCDTTNPNQAFFQDCYN